MNNNKLVLALTFASLSLFSLYFFVIYFKEIFDFANLANVRLGSYFDNVNGVGGYFVTAFLISCYYLLFSKLKYGIIFFVPTIFFALLGTTTGSRTFLLTIIVGLFSLVFIRYRKKKILLFSISILLFASIALLLFLPFLSNLRDRLFSFFAYIEGENIDYSTLTRTLWQKYGIYLGVRHLLFGTGAYGFMALSGVGTYTHGNFAEMICNFGVIGFLVYYSLFAIAFKDSFKSKGSFKYFAYAILVAYLFKGILTVYYYDKLTVFELSLCIHLCLPFLESKYNADASGVILYRHIYV
ncbi:MAG: O-antigen ligase family protein [Bacilli bacterium]|nr:O-antigen ligase family protein [Bacilli bacterium]